MAVDKRNVFLENTAETMSYSSAPKPVGSSYPSRNITSHAQNIEGKLQQAYESAITQKQAAAIRYKEGVYLEFSSASKHDLAVKSLENRTQGIRLLNVHTDLESEITKATIYIPEGKEAYFINKVEPMPRKRKKWKS